MPNVITTIRPSTEVQAISVMLGAIGEPPLAAGTDLATLAEGNADVQSAVEILRETTRNILTAGWRFNTLTGFELKPTTTYAWLDTAGVTTTLNIFKRPADVLAWAQTRCSQNAGVELIERPSLKYTEGSAPAMVLFDRVRNRDGVEATRYPKLYIEAVFAVDFEQMPESARRAAAIFAARIFCQRVPASDLQAQFTEQDETAALRVLKREQGLKKALNLFQTSTSMEIAGRRPLIGGGFNTRVFPGGA